MNYVKPITVNIYFKQAAPGVGTYDPNPVRKDVPATKSVFASKTGRGVITKKLIRQGELEPAPGTYDPQYGFD